MIELLNNLDGNILLIIQEYFRNDVLTVIFTLITSLGDKGMIWVLISAILCIPKKTRRIGIACLLSLLGSLIINNGILKNLIQRSRPFDQIDALIPLINKPRDYSFPSGHTGSSFACAWILLRRLPKKYGIPALILAIGISLSRLYLGVHYPSDVIVGMMSGILISYLAEFCVNKFQNVKLNK